MRSRSRCLFRAAARACVPGAPGGVAGTAARTARKQAAPPAAAATAALRSAEALAGTRASRAPILQLFTDLDVTLQADHRLVWRIDFDRFQVPQPDGLAPAALDLHLVCDAATGAPVCAYSTAAATGWPKAQLPQEGAFAHRLADVATITPTLAQTLPQSPLAQILTAAWSVGVSMISSQQVIARFCNAVTPLPARRVGTDLVPLRAPGPAWLVSGLELQAPFEAEHYDTQTHVLVDDATATCVLGFRSP